MKNRVVEAESIEKNKFHETRNLDVKIQESIFEESFWITCDNRKHDDHESRQKNHNSRYRTFWHLKIEMQIKRKNQDE